MEKDRKDKRKASRQRKSKNKNKNNFKNIKHITSQDTKSVTNNT